MGKEAEGPWRSGTRVNFELLVPSSRPAPSVAKTRRQFLPLAPSCVLKGEKATQGERGGPWEIGTGERGGSWENDVNCTLRSTLIARTTITGS